MKIHASHRSARSDDAFRETGERETFAPSVPSTLPVSETAPPAGSDSLRRDLRCSIADGSLFSVMVGIGETYFPAFVLALGMGEIASGLVASVPLLIGAVLQLISPYAVARLGSNRRWVITCVTLQAVSFLPLVAAALSGTASVLLVFGAVSLYWGAGLGAGPAWNTWMETVVPQRVRAPFFAMRTRFGQASVLLGFVLGGIALQYGKNTGYILWAFSAVFAIAGICRFLSARYLSYQSEIQTVREAQRNVPTLELFRRIRRGGSERVLLYFLAVQVMVQISGPYFSPFMLGQLKISYLEYMMLLATSFLGKIVMLPINGKLAARFGAMRLLWFGGIGIIPVSGLWLYVGNSYPALMALQFFAGVVFLLFFETVRRDERTSILTTFNLANQSALVLGAVLGGAILKFLGECPQAYLVLFAVSSFGRAISLIVLRVSPQESTVVAEVEPLPKPRTGPVPLAAPATVSAPSR
jgi:MFS family permease